MKQRWICLYIFSFSRQVYNPLRWQIQNMTMGNFFLGTLYSTKLGSAFGKRTSATWEHRWRYILLFVIGYLGGRKLKGMYTKLYIASQSKWKGIDDKRERNKVNIAQKPDTSCSGRQLRCSNYNYSYNRISFTSDCFKLFLLPLLSNNCALYQSQHWNVIWNWQLKGIYKKIIQTKKSCLLLNVQ